jgi:NTP pyrophosphatase (non-canonical NTP hydrolase)
MGDESTTLSALKDKVKKFCEERDWDQFHNPKDLAIGISTEANELLEIFRFKSEKEMKEIMKNPEKRRKVGEELADVFFFLLRFAQINDFNLSDELEEKIRKNEERYPISKAKGSNKKYNEL